MKTLFLAVTLALSVSSVYAADATMQADDNAINSACASDAQTAGCAGEKVGHGLIKCLFKYKHDNKGFKFSEGCKAAMKQHREDKKAGK